MDIIPTVDADTEMTNDEKEERKKNRVYLMMWPLLNFMSMAMGLSSGRGRSGSGGGWIMFMFMFMIE